MKVNFIEELNTVEVEFDTDDRVTSTIVDLQDELDGVGVALNIENLEKLFEGAVRNGKASICLDDGTDKPSNNGGTKTAVEEEQDSYEESSDEGNTKANTVGNWLASFIANGYRIQKAQVLRGQVVEQLEFKGDLLIRKQHLCGPNIKILKMIVDEMTSTSSGCAGRLIESIDSLEESNIIYTKLSIEGNIVLKYKLVKLESYSNSLNSSYHMKKGGW